MKKTLFFLTLIMGAIIPSSAQQLPTSFEVWLPEYIEHTNGTPQGIGKSETWQNWCERQIKSGNFGKNTKKVWSVYSDRANNPAYANTTTSSAVVKQLSFGEKFFVAKISNGMALLFTDEYLPSYPKINKTAQVVGWVPIENLLLYEECPKTQSQIYLKGLVVHDPTKGKATEQNPKYKLIPGGNLDATRSAKDLDILFVMKKMSITGGSYYLMSNSMNCHNIRATLLGWLPEEYVTEWTQRLVLEPTHASMAVREYNEKSCLPTAFVQYDNANVYLNSGAVNTPIWVYNNFSTTRQNSYEMRLPILDNTSNNDIFQVAVMTNLATKGQQVPDRARIEEELEKLRTKKSKINIVFVIDATSSMRKYYSSVSGALLDVMQRSYFQDANIQVGCVLYRDYKDHAAKGGVEYRPCTKDLKTISSYLNQVEVGSNDPDDWEAMFDGIEVALDYGKMKYHPEESNFIILIGDAGNHPKDNKGRTWRSVTTELANKMANNRINFLAYQINHAGADAYDDFASQVGVMQKSLTKDYENILKKPEGTMEYKLVSNRCYRLVRKSTQKADMPIYNMYRYAPTGTAESPTNLTKMISSNIEEFQKWVKDQIQMLEESLNGGGPIGTSGDAKVDQILEYLRLNNWTEKQISDYIDYLKRGGSGKFIANSPMKIKGKRTDLYDYVLFFSENEFDNLLHELDVVNQNSADDRKSYQDAVMAMGQAMLGNFNGSTIGQMTMEDLMSQIYGVPIKMQSCGFRIDQIINIDRAELQKLLSDFKEKLSGLHNIRQNSYDGRFQKNGIVYYWIPLDNMPGYCTDKR